MDTWHENTNRVSPAPWPRRSSSFERPRDVYSGSGARDASSPNVRIENEHKNASSTRRIPGEWSLEDQIAELQLELRKDGRSRSRSGGWQDRHGYGHSLSQDARDYEDKIQLSIAQQKLREAEEKLERERREDEMERREELIKRRLEMKYLKDRAEREAEEDRIKLQERLLRQEWELQREKELLERDRSRKEQGERRTRRRHDGDSSDESPERKPRVTHVNIYNTIRADSNGYDHMQLTGSQPSRPNAVNKEAVHIEQPPDDIVNTSFDRIMLRKGWYELPDDAREAMMAYPASKKWDIISRDRVHGVERGDPNRESRSVRFGEVPEIISPHDETPTKQSSADWDSEHPPVDAKKHRSVLKGRDTALKNVSLDASLKRQELELQLVRSFFENEMQTQRAELKEYHRDLHSNIKGLRDDIGLLKKQIERVSSRFESESSKDWYTQLSTSGQLERYRPVQHESYPKPIPPVTVEDEHETTDIQTSPYAPHGVEEIEDDVPDLEAESSGDADNLEGDDPGDSTASETDNTDFRLEIYEDRTSAEMESPIAVVGPYILSDRESDLHEHWTEIRDSLPISRTADMQYARVNGTSEEHGTWTCLPMKGDASVYPLKLAKAPVVIPVQNRWPPMAGVNAPPDPRGTQLIDCRADLPVEVIQDIFSTFKGCIGAYLLVNGYLQILVPDDFNMEWAASHYPHRFGGLKVSYIHDTRTPTMNSKKSSSSSTVTSSYGSGTKMPTMASKGHKPGSSNHVATRSLQLNDIIAARPSSSLRRAAKYSGRIGLQIKKNGVPYLIMSTHVITQAMTHRDRISARLGRGRNELPTDWMKRVEVIVRNKKFGALEQTFDPDASVYPMGFKHDVTLISPSNATLVKDMTSPITNLGWLSHKSWSSLCQHTSGIEFLASTEPKRKAKTLQTNLPSKVECVGRGIFLNQQETLGSKSDEGIDLAAWKDMISIALLYRVDPKFDQPYGYSGTALVANGVREDGSNGPGVVGFQSFVQHSDVTQVHNEDGDVLNERLEKGIVAFYGAFEVPEQLKKEYTIV